MNVYKGCNFERNIVLYYGIESSVQERLGRHPLLSPLLKPTRTNVVMASLPRLSDTYFHLSPYQGIRYKNLSRRFCSHYSHPPPFQLVEILPTILPPRLACQTCQPRHLHGASRFQAHLIFDIFGRTIFCLKICAKNCTNSNTIYIATLKTAFFTFVLVTKRKF